MREKPETNLPLFISWLTSTVVILHVIYGTAILSSTLFVSALDALGVIGQFLGSTLVCRAILTYELRGMRLVVKPQTEEDEEHQRMRAHITPNKFQYPNHGMAYRQTAQW